MVMLYKSIIMDSTWLLCLRYPSLQMSSLTNKSYTLGLDIKMAQTSLAAITVNAIFWTQKHCNCVVGL